MRWLNFESRLEKTELTLESSGVCSVLGLGLSLEIGEVFCKTARGLLQSPCYGVHDTPAEHVHSGIDLRSAPQKRKQLSHYFLHAL